MKKWMGAMGVLVLGSLLMATPKAVKKGGEDTLSPGNYTATIRSFVCGGCAEWVESKLSKMKTLESVRVDQETRRVQFTIKKDAGVNRAEIQKTLDGAAKEMGMGADFTLEGLTKSR